jgi:hypothetical protein
MITIPSDFIASTTSMISQMFLDLKDLIVLGLGIAIGFYVIRKLIKTMKEGIGR